MVAKKIKKVAIVGGSPDSQMLAPFDDYDWDIWVLGNQMNSYDGKRVDLVFEIHDNLSEQPHDYPEWLLEYAPKLMVGPEFPIKDHEKIELYPKEDVNALLGFEALSSSPAYMFGFAVLRGYKEIAIYGVAMGVDNHEYFKQRPVLYSWIGYAKGKGIKVTIPKEATLLKDNYDEGRDWNNSKPTGPFTIASFEEAIKEHESKCAEIENQIRELVVHKGRHEGCISTYNQMIKIARGMEGGAQINSISEVTRLK